jgi:ferric-dicitrate binding protein FerR (iron transport regulator)
MVWRKVLATLLIAVASSPTWGAAEPLGSITTASAATVRNTNLSEGSTVFSGDIISVATNGVTRIALNGGAQVQILGGSLIRLNKAAEKIQVIVDQGQASFHSSGNNGISALVADATVRPANGEETSAFIQSLSETHAVIEAEKGALLITTAHDGKTYTVSEGEAADLSAVEASPSADPQQNSGAAPAGKSAPAYSAPSKRVVIWTVAILGAAAVGTSVYLIRKEHKPSTTDLGNEISPSKLD